MKIQPQFSGVYLKPAQRDIPLKTSTTGHGEFEYDGKSYYTTEEDTVTLHRTRQDNPKEEVLTNLYRELAAKAPADNFPTLAGLAAAQISKSVTQPAHPVIKAVARLLGQKDTDSAEFISPRQALQKRGLVDETTLDAVDLGLQSLDKNK